MAMLCINIENMGDFFNLFEIMNVFFLYNKHYKEYILFTSKQSKEDSLCIQERLLISMC